jgi:repressor LexA
MKPPYTSRQGQFLAFIHHYTTLHGRPPAEAELVGFFQITPPSVHQMILTLERRRLISRTPGQARSIRLAIPYETLPPLQSGSVSASTRLPARQTEGSQPADTEAIMLRLGKIQIDALFAQKTRHTLGEAKFISLLDAVIGSFTHAEVNARMVDELRDYARTQYERYS